MQDSVNNPDYKSFSYTWPGFVWYLLTDRQILEHYSPAFLWKLIPQQWRKWWLPSLKRKFGHHYSSVSINEPKSIIVDRTEDLLEWNSTLNTNVLPDTAKCCNKHLLPTILCPWGCTEYIHKHGSIDFSTVLQKCMPKVQLCTTTRESYKNIVSARDDYIRTTYSDYDVWLLNPDWKVMPSIVIDIQKGPVSLTCHDHDKGSSKYMIHTCRQPNHIIPALRPDQLAPCVNRPRTVKPVKKSKFSTTYQMHEQKGSFNGIDTCSVTLFGKFDFQSTLSAMNDARALSQRPDIHAHLNTLVKEKIISSTVASGRVDDAEFRSRDIDFEPYYNASTYIPLDITLSMQKENAQPRYSKTGTEINDISESNSFKIGWPLNIYPCQTLNDHGTHPHLPPTFAIRSPGPLDHFQLSAMWTLSSILLNVESIWEKAVSFQSYGRESWQGWLLTYLTKHSLNHISMRQDRHDPFKSCQISSVKAMASKVVPLIMDVDDVVVKKPLSQLFIDFHGILCLDGNTFQTTTTLLNGIHNELNTIEHEIIIIENYSKEADDLPLQIHCGDNTVYELCLISKVLIHEDNKWDGFVSMRHGGAHSQWWHSSRKSTVCVKRRQHLTIKDNEEYNLVYSMIKKPNLMDASQQVMSHIGGQSNVQCHHHKMPMILSTFRKGKCHCTKKEYYRCPDVNCSIKCCKKCLDNAGTSHIEQQSSS